MVWAGFEVGFGISVKNHADPQPQIMIWSKFKNFDFLRISERYFSQEEQIFLINSEDPKRLFFDLWSRKEAIIKAKGKRLLAEIKKTNISFVDNKIPLKCKIQKNEFKKTRIFQMLIES